MDGSASFLTSTIVTSHPTARPPLTSSTPSSYFVASLLLAALSLASNASSKPPRGSGPRSKENVMFKLNLKSKNLVDRVGHSLFVGRVQTTVDI